MVGCSEEEEDGAAVGCAEEAGTEKEEVSEVRVGEAVEEARVGSDHGWAIVLPLRASCCSLLVET